MPRASARVFVALSLGPRLSVEALAAVEKALAADAGRWRLPRAESLHVTLLFLGDVARDALGELEAGLARELAGSLAPRMRIDRAGAFPETGAARVLWLGADEVPGTEGRLEELRRRACAGAAAVGLGAARAGEPFRAHITVARPRGRPRRPSAAFLGLVPGLAFEPAEAVLFESLRETSGPPVYTRLAEFALAR